MGIRHLARDGELAALIDQAAALPAPVILAGDLNLGAGSRAHRGLPEEWHDAFAEAGRGFGHTYPVPDREHEGEESPWLARPFALLRIDYILTRGEIRPTGAWTEVLVDSDHLALLADLELTGSR